MTAPPVPVRFCSARDGTRIAYAVAGRGPALVKTSGFLSHLEHEWSSPVWRPWLDALGRERRLVRFDSRGCGLSDREVADLSLDAAVEDLNAVTTAAGVERFVLFGQSQGVAVSIAYALRHPGRVSGLVLVGGYARGLLRTEPPPERVRQVKAVLELVEVGWGQDNPAFRQMFTSMFVPGGTPEQVAWFNELQRISTTPAIAARLLSAALEIDVVDLAAQVRCPTLVIHSTGDARVPFESGRALAALIPGARFVPVESPNHIVLSHEPAFTALMAEIDDFVGLAAPLASSAALQALTTRERELLDLIARGHTNGAIATRLGLSEKTVRNHINSIFSKLAVANRGEAIVQAREAGLGREAGSR